MYSGDLDTVLSLFETALKEDGDEINHNLDFRTIFSYREIFQTKPTKSKFESLMSIASQ